MKFCINIVLVSILYCGITCTVSAQNSQSQRRHNYLLNQQNRNVSARLVQLGNIGFYNMSLGAGDTSSEEQPIINAGFTPVQIFNLSQAELANLDVLFVYNPDNFGYGSEYLAQLTVIQDAVANGMVLIIHDRFVNGASSILPDGAGVIALRDFSDESNIDIVDDTTLLTSGLDNTSLDGGSSSSHGYVESSSLPPGGITILSRTDPTEAVTFTYQFGSGDVIYSTIPLDFYLSGDSGIVALEAVMASYASNTVEYALALFEEENTISIPTMGEWGLIFLSILLLIFGTTCIREVIKADLEVS